MSNEPKIDPEARHKSDFGAIVGLEKALAFNVSGHVLHSIFWKNLSPDGGDKPGVFVFRNLDDCRKITAYAMGKKRGVRLASSKPDI